MKANKFIRNILGLMLLLLLHSSASAQRFQFPTTEASNIKSGYDIRHHGFPDTITTWCNEWTEMLTLGLTSWQPEFKFKSKTSIIKLMIDNTYPKTQDGFIHKITYEFRGYKTLADTTLYDVFYDTLTVANITQSDYHTAYQDQNIARFSNYYKTMLIVTGAYKWDVSPTGSVTPISLLDSTKDCWAVENTIITQRYDKRLSGTDYYGASGGIFTTPVPHEEENRLKIFIGTTMWDTTPVVVKPANYELEWTYVDDYKVDPITGSTTYETDLNKLKFDFKHNSSRVWLTENYYNIPLVYPHGYVVFRARMVRPDSNTYKYPIYSSWSNGDVDYGSINDLGSDGYYELSSAFMHDSMNWSYNINFAEGGKYKHVISYFDGMLKNRESVTRFNSDRNYVIATKSVYDYEGRPCINFLPVPVIQPKINYVYNFDLNDATVLPYKAADFDTIPGSCPSDYFISPVHKTAKSGIYFSPDNPDMSGVQQYVPDAEGYPFTYSILAPAYEDRIQVISGLGSSLQIKDSNVAKFNYVSASQFNINRLLGLGGGYAEYYRETIQKDPNGQLSSEIKDYKGRIIASSFIGTGGDSARIAIDPMSVPEPTVYNEDMLNGAPQMKDGNTKIADLDFFNDAAGSVNFQYAYDFRPLELCPGLYLGTKVRYYYEVSDVCDNVVYREDSTIGTNGLTTSYTPFEGPINAVYLNQGQYNIHKELTVEPIDIESVLDSFFAIGSCVKKQPEFIREAVEKRQFPCPGAISSPCGQKRWEMMQELHPNAKYGKYHDSLGHVVGTFNSIFTIRIDTNGAHLDSNIVAGGAYWSDYIKYRYQDTCTRYTLSDTMTINGVTYTNMRTMSIDSFINLYNLSIATEPSDPIAAALLPLHPEYCYLNACFEDTFKQALEVLPNFSMAETQHLLLLDSIIAKDPAVPYLTASGLSSAVDSLSTFMGGTIRLDFPIFQAAYCGCGDSIMDLVCTEELYAYEISHRLLVNDYVKQKYFSNLISLYLTNRQRFIDRVVFSGGNGCPHCADNRMLLEPVGIFGGISATGGAPDIYDIISDTSWAGVDHAAWLMSSITALASGGAIADSVLSSLYDSTSSLYSASDSLLCNSQVNYIVGKLINCAVLDTSVLSDVRHTLDSMCHAGIVINGTYTPEMVRFAIVRNGLALTDLCNPYIVSYMPALPDLTEGQNCKSDSFYAAMKLYFNDTQFVNALRYPGTLRKDTLRYTTNEFESRMYTILGTDKVEYKSAWNSSDTVYKLNVFRDHSLPMPPGDTVRIYFRASNYCGNAFSRGDSVSIYAVSCVNTLSGRVAMGYMNVFSFVTDVAIYDTTGTATLSHICPMLCWNDTIATMNLANNSIASCVPCTEMRKIYQDFSDTMAAYNLKGSDHPLWQNMMMNFTNLRLKRTFDGEQYENFIHSCALADSMKMPLYFGYSNISFNNKENADTFLARYGRVAGTILLDGIYMDSSSLGGIRVAINNAGYDFDKLGIYKNFVDTYSAPYIIKHNADRFLKMNDTLSIGNLYVPVGTVMPSATDIFGAGTPFTIHHISDIKAVWNGTEFFPADYYEVLRTTSTPNYQISRAAYQMFKYSSEHSSLGIIYNPYYESTINRDYYKTKKQNYLSYAYKFQNLPPYTVLDSLQAQYLVARIPSYAGSKTSYVSPYNATIVTDLYTSDPSGTLPYFDTLRKIFRYVKDSNTVSTGDIFFASNSVPILHDSSLYAYRCSDGSYWYRYFGGGDSLWNVYLKFPKWVPAYRHTQYKIIALTSAPYLRADIGDTNTRYFNILLKRTGFADTIEAKGMTSFKLAKNLRLKDVLLGNPLLYDESDPIYADVDTFNNCERNILRNGIIEGIVNYNYYIDSYKNTLRALALSWMADSITEHLYRGAIDQRFNYTLYYYDRAGNLATTIPPMGVVKLDTSLMTEIDHRRRFTSTLYDYPDLYGWHGKRTQTNYNSLNAPTLTMSPESAVTYWYDNLGRLILSQNNKQAPDRFYTYNLYDDQGRIIETGQAKVGDDISDNLRLLPHADVRTAILHKTRFDVVVSIYDTSVVGLDTIRGMDKQQYLRKRIAAIKYFDTLWDIDTFQKQYTYCSHYSYDVQGNVKTLVQDCPQMGWVNQRFKRIDYDYDLISGKVNMLSYNRSFADQYYQRYYYDDDNRITKVETSNDGQIWQRDAEYTYYKHGPLARVEVGDLRVQGIDFAYTIQGWIKSVNGDTLNKSLDMGKDGQDNIVATDAMAYALDYFKRDYTAINGETLIHNTDINRKLYNGNIARQTVHLPSDTIGLFTGYADTSLFRLTRSFVYDQLNRIKTAKYAYFDPTTGAPTPTEQYYNAYSYDADGNIERLIRNGNNPANLAMDRLSYTYGDGSAYSLNQLYAVEETEDDHYDNDIKQNDSYTSTGAATYMYDATGNTIKDMVAGRDTIVWNLYNKVLWTTAAGSYGIDSLIFRYDGAGNRISKTLSHNLDSGIFRNTEYYVRDASGNILATYKYNRRIFQFDGSVRRGRFWLASHDIYGSSRLGSKTYFPAQKYKYDDNEYNIHDSATIVDRKPWYSLELQDQINMEATDPYNNTFTTRYVYAHILGQKLYELTDHLGNVMVTINDIRQSISDTPGLNHTIAYYKSVDKSVSDYYPYGMLMPGRNKNSGKTTYTIPATTITNLPEHNYSAVSLPTGGEVFFGTGTTATSGATYNLTAPGGGGVAYTIAPMKGGVSHTYKVMVAAIPAGALFIVEIVDATGVIIGTYSLYTGANNITFTPPSDAPVTLKIINGLSGSTPYTIKLNNLVKDSISFLPQMSTSMIANGGVYQYGYNGKMKDNEWAGAGNSLDFGNRLFDTRAIRFSSLDKYMQKFPSQSPYVYAANSPIGAKDVNGDYVYILAYTTANHHGGDKMFHAAALTRAYDITHSKGFDAKRDVVAVIAVTDLGKIAQQVQSVTSTLGPKYGKTKEFGLWSHSSAVDGAIGSVPTSKYAAIGDRAQKQMSMEGWGKINFNWSGDGNIAGIYGCNGGNANWAGGVSFGTKLSGLSNFKDVSVLAQPGYSFPSQYTDERNTGLYQAMGDYLPIESIQGRSELTIVNKTYLVSGKKDEGIQSLLWSTTASPMQVSVNGQPVGTQTQPGSQANPSATPQTPATPQSSGQ